MAEPRRIEAKSRRVSRVGIQGLVLFYIGVILLAPVVAMAWEAATVAENARGASIDTETVYSAFGRSIALAGLAAVLNGAIGVGAGLILVRHRFVGRNVLDALVDLPLAVSPVMIGLGFLTLFGRDGWLEPMVDSLGIEVVFAFPGMALATLFVTLPYTVREVVYVLEELGTSEEEAARTLGATPLSTFLRVTLPNLRHALAYGVVMTVARALGEFGAVLVLGGSVAGVTQTATTLVHDALEERLDLTAYTVAGLLCLVSLVLLAALQWIGQRASTEKDSWTSEQSA